TEPKSVKRATWSGDGQFFLLQSDGLTVHDAAGRIIRQLPTSKLTDLCIHPSNLFFAGTSGKQILVWRNERPSFATWLDQ
ncbi:MAG: hypothetical protein AAFZ52_14535, partial [Bacteroidota bacterium]